MDITTPELKTKNLKLDLDGGLDFDITKLNLSGYALPRFQIKENGEQIPPQLTLKIPKTKIFVNLRLSDHMGIHFYLERNVWISDEHDNGLEITLGGFDTIIPKIEIKFEGDAKGSATLKG
jgi:hypothetical protein